MTAPGTEEAAKLLDLENRDPNALNRSVQTLFEDVIGEPDGAHSAPKIFRTAYRSYYIGKNCCFTFMTYLCSVPMGFCWGCTYAFMSFCQIWQMTPFVRLFNQCFACWGSLYSTVCHCYLDPCYEAAALVFTRIFITHIKSDRGYISRKIEELNEVKDQDLPRV